MSNKYFADFSFNDFWEKSDYAAENYTGSIITEEMVNHAEKQLGYKLPQSYVELLKIQNGGIPNKKCFPTKVATSWAEDHIEINGILGIGHKVNSICGQLGSQFMIDEWGYPDIGVLICDCPSAGHDSIMFDYRECVKNGEPCVVHVEVEINDEPVITFLAKDFETFIMGLVDTKEFLI